MGTTAITSILVWLVEPLVDLSLLSRSHARAGAPSTIRCQARSAFVARLIHLHHVKVELFPIGKLRRRAKEHDFRPSQQQQLFGKTTRDKNEHHQQHFVLDHPRALLRPPSTTTPTNDRAFNTAHFHIALSYDDLRLQRFLRDFSFQPIQEASSDHVSRKLLRRRRARR